MSRCRRGLGVTLGLALLVVNLAPAAEPATEASTPGVRVKRHTLKELRDQYVVKQRLDYSCGAAALATLMRYYFNEPTSERDVLRLLVARLDADEQRVKEMRGFSLLDLKYAAEALGYQAAGFKLTVNDLVKLNAPVIVFVRPLGYAHFAVLRGIAGGRVYLADPARGNVRMGIGRFLGEWEGVVFVLGRRGEEGIGTHALSVPRRDDIAPPLRSLNRLWESGAASIDLSRPGRVR